jgi:prevent-host-death family protein
MKVSVYEAKSKLSQMINAALDGEEVVITRNGKETVKLVPATNGDTKNSWIGMWDGQIDIPDSFFEPLEEFEEYT